MSGKLAMIIIISELYDSVMEAHRREVQSEPLSRRQRPE